MPNPSPIRIDTDTWVVMRYEKEHPAAIITRITDTAGEARFLALVWHVDPAKRRMAGIYPSLQAADASVLWDRSPVERAARLNSGPPNGLLQQRKGAAG